MATQYTQVLKLALPTQGELTGTWGNVVNDEITSLVEEAIAGMKVINNWVANSKTLTVLEGLPSESRAAILRLTDTGAQLTANGTVVCPNATKVYLVENLTGRTITVKTAAGAGVAIPTGTAAVVFCDGTKVVNGVTYLPYNNTASGLTATTVQGAIDELNTAEGSTSQALVNHLADTIDAHDASAISYGNTTSGLTADNTQAAIDEVVVVTTNNASAIAANTSAIAANTSAINTLSSGLSGVETSVYWQPEVNASTTLTVNTRVPVLATSAPVDLTPPTFAEGDTLEIHNSNGSTQTVRLLNPSNTIRGTAGDAVAGENVIIGAGETVRLYAESPTILEIV